MHQVAQRRSAKLGTMEIHGWKSIRLSGALLLCAVLSACGSSVSPSPVATPSPASGWPALPHVMPAIASTNFFPVDNQAQVAGGNAKGSAYMNFGTLAAVVAGGHCGDAIGTFGDYRIDYNEVFEDYTIFQAATFSNVDPYYVITKNAAGDVYIVGYTASWNGPETCVTPYLWVKADLRPGDSWQFTDLAGRAYTASVVSVGQTQSFTVTVENADGPPYGGQSFTYSNVAEITYGPAFTMYWAAGYGPVRTENAVDIDGIPFDWTLFGYVVDKNSK